MFFLIFNENTKTVKIINFLNSIWSYNLLKINIIEINLKFYGHLSNTIRNTYKYWSYENLSLHVFKNYQNSIQETT